MKMKPQESKNEQGFSLRQQAELALQGKLVNLQSWTLEDIQNLIHELQIQQVELELQNEQMRALTARLAEVQELERQQLARELHDEIGQNLTALGFNLSFIETQLANPSPKLPPLLRQAQDKLQERLRDSLNLVEQTADRIRDVMSELRPPMLDDYGLVDALDWYGHRFAKRMELKVEVEGDSNLPRLEPAVENALFRITQEALNNVAKHAQATLVTISIFEIGNIIRLVILDDGLGFDPARRNRTSIPPGLGLLTMRERAEAVGGSCWIESQPGQGTRVIVEVSL